MLFHKIKNAKSAHTNKTAAPNAEAEESLMKFFNYCVLKNDRTKLKTKLRGTVDLRRKILKERKDEYMNFIHFYFVDIQMVRFNVI